METRKCPLTLQLEDLTPPKFFLPEFSPEQIVQSDKHWKKGFLCSSLDKKLFFTSKQNPVILDFVKAYKDHRPIILSPDIIWLLIVQGFSHHVYNNSEELRHHFVNFDGRKTLQVAEISTNPDLTDRKRWENTFPCFVEHMSQYLDLNLINVLSPNFSTTTPVSRVVGQISIMTSFQKYFEYKFDIFGCGIPFITIEGSNEDWKKIREKLEIIRAFDLEWWVSKLVPIIEEFINAKQGIVNKEFWLRMVRYKNKKSIYDVNKIDGWICAFYPYDTDGNRFSLNEICDESCFDNIPGNILSVPINVTISGVGNMRQFDVACYSGFFGMVQNHQNFALKPEIGWLIATKPTSTISINMTGIDRLYGEKVCVQFGKLDFGINPHPIPEKYIADYLERLERERLERERLERERLERERLKRERFEKIRQERKIQMLEKTNPLIFLNVQGKSIKIIAPKISSSQRKSINSHPLITNKSNSTDIQTKPEPKEIEQEYSEKGVLKYEHFHIFSEDFFDL